MSQLLWCSLEVRLLAQPAAGPLSILTFAPIFVTGLRNLMPAYSDKHTHTNYIKYNVKIVGGVAFF